MCFGRLIVVWGSGEGWEGAIKQSVDAHMSHQHSYSDGTPPCQQSALKGEEDKQLEDADDCLPIFFDILPAG